MWFGFMFFFMNNIKVFCLILIEFDNIEKCLVNGSFKYSILLVDSFYLFWVFDVKFIKIFFLIILLLFFWKKIGGCSFIDICKFRGLNFEFWYLIN